MLDLRNASGEEATIAVLAFCNDYRKPVVCCRKKRLQTACEAAAGCFARWSGRKATTESLRYRFRLLVESAHLFALSWSDWADGVRDGTVTVTFPKYAESVLNVTSGKALHSAYITYCMCFVLAVLTAADAQLAEVVASHPPLRCFDSKFKARFARSLGHGVPLVAAPHGGLRGNRGGAGIPKLLYMDVKPWLDVFKDLLKGKYCITLFTSTRVTDFTAVRFWP